MNSVSYHSDEQVQAMLDKFEQISNKDNTKITPLSTLIQLVCDCGCQMVEHFSGPFFKKCERYYVNLCHKHEITFSNDDQKTKVTTNL